MSRAASRLKQGAILNFKSERAAALNFKSRRDEFYRAFLARGSCGAAIASDEILRSRGKNFKACGKSGGVKFLKPKFRGEQKEGCDAKYR